MRGFRCEGPVRTFLVQQCRPCRFVPATHLNFIGVGHHHTDCVAEMAWLSGRCDAFLDVPRREVFDFDPAKKLGAVPSLAPLVVSDVVEKEACQEV